MQRQVIVGFARLIHVLLQSMCLILIQSLGKDTLIECSMSLLLAAEGLASLFGVTSLMGLGTKWVCFQILMRVPIVYMTANIQIICAVISLMVRYYITKEIMIAMNMAIVGMVLWPKLTLAVMAHLKSRIRLQHHSNWHCWRNKPMRARAVTLVMSLRQTSVLQVVRTKLQ